MTSVLVFERHAAQDQLWSCLQVLHMCPSRKPHRVEDGEKLSLTEELMECHGWGQWGDVINTACTPTTEEISSGAQEGFWVGTWSRGKKCSSFHVLAARFTQPSLSPALSELLCIPYVPFALHFSSGWFPFLTSSYCSMKTKSFWVLFSVQSGQNEKMQVCSMWSCSLDYEKFWNQWETTIYL